MSLKLDRIELEDVGANPQRLAQAVLKQMSYIKGSIAIHEVAQALDIIEIQIEKLTSFEGALLTLPGRGYGSILVNAHSSPRRQRFTIAHELGHFLNPLHRPTTAAGFRCTRGDMSVSSQKEMNRHLRQEAEANTFAIELLAPRRRVKHFTRSDAELGNVLPMVTEFDISKEAAVRRYVELHDDPLTVVFSKDNRVVYCVKGNDFPRLCLNSKDAIPDLLPTHKTGNLTEMEEVDPIEWLAKPQSHCLSVQTLYQQNNYAMTLLRLIVADEEDDPGFDDAFERYSQFSHSDRD